MRMGVPLSSVNCFEGRGFLASLAPDTGAMRVPNPAAGMITYTFIAGCQYTSVKAASSNCPAGDAILRPPGHPEGIGRGTIDVGQRCNRNLHPWLALDRSIGQRCRGGRNG